MDLVSVKDFLDKELSEDIVYIDKEYVRYIVDEVLKINSKETVSKEFLVKTFDKYIEEHPKSKTIINNLKSNIIK